MKKIFLLCFLVTNVTFAQNSKKKELVAKLTESTCTCTSKNKVAPSKLKVTLGLCLLEAISANKTEVFKAYDKKNIDSELIEKVGQDIGAKMLDICPETMEILLNDKELMKEIAEDNDLEVSAEESEENSTITGTFIEIKNDSYLYVVVKETSGRSNQFVILQNFENVFLVTDKVLKTNDSVTVTYYEAELYDAKLNKFITLKVATDIQKL